MNDKIKGYLKTEMIIAAAFNFFINGMVAALIHHKSDYVATDLISIATDLTATCIFTFILTALLSKSSVKRSKTAGIIENGSRLIRYLSKLFQNPVMFGMFMGIVAAVVLFALAAPFFALLGITVLPFGVYVALKCVFTALFGASVTLLELYTGMCKT